MISRWKTSLDRLRTPSSTLTRSLNQASLTRISPLKPPPAPSIQSIQRSHPLHIKMKKSKALVRKHSSLIKATNHRHKLRLSLISYLTRMQSARRSQPRRPLSPLKATLSQMTMLMTMSTLTLVRLKTSSQLQKQC